jgi:hypothetical protein
MTTNAVNPDNTPTWRPSPMHNPRPRRLVVPRLPLAREESVVVRPNDARCEA